jgi:hypothetical protein
MKGGDCGCNCQCGPMLHEKKGDKVVKKNKAQAVQKAKKAHQRGE